MPYDLDAALSAFDQQTGQSAYDVDSAVKAFDDATQTTTQRAPMPPAPQTPPEPTDAERAKALSSRLKGGLTTTLAPAPAHAVAAGVLGATAGLAANVPALGRITRRFAPPPIDTAPSPDYAGKIPYLTEAARFGGNLMRDLPEAMVTAAGGPAALAVTLAAQQADNAAYQQELYRRQTKEEGGYLSDLGRGVGILPMNEQDTPVMRAARAALVPGAAVAGVGGSRVAGAVAEKAIAPKLAANVGYGAATGVAQQAIANAGAGEAPTQGLGTAGMVGGIMGSVDAARRRPMAVEPRPAAEPIAAPEIPGQEPVTLGDETLPEIRPQVQQTPSPAPLVEAQRGPEQTGIAQPISKATTGSGEVVLKPETPNDEIQNRLHSGEPIKFYHGVADGAVVDDILNSGILKSEYDDVYMTVDPKYALEYAKNNPQNVIEFQVHPDDAKRISMSGDEPGTVVAGDWKPVRIVNARRMETPAAVERPVTPEERTPANELLQEVGQGQGQGLLTTGQPEIQGAEPPATPPTSPPTAEQSPAGGEPVPPITPYIDRAQAGENMGRPELANPGSTPEARQVQDAVDQLRADTGQPEPQNRADARARALARVEADYEGEKQRISEAMSKGALPNQDDKFVAQLIADRAMQKSARERSFKNDLEAWRLSNALRESLGDTARVLASAADLYASPRERMQGFIDDLITMPDPGDAKKLLEAKQGKGGYSRAALERLAARKMAKLRDKAAAAGLDLSKYTDEQLNDPVVINDLMNKGSILRADVSDKIFEAWRNAILSGPRTQLVNFTGNALNATGHIFYRRPMEAIINTMMNRTDAMTIADLPEFWRGMLPGMMRGVRNALLSYQTESRVLDEHVNGPRQPKDILKENGPKIGGQTGRTIRTPQRTLGAADEFMKAILGEMEAGAKAHVIARNEGLTGDAAVRRVMDLTGDMQSEAWKFGLEKAEMLLFQADMGKRLAGLRGLRSIPGVRYLIPFIETPANIFRLGIRRSILGAPMALKAQADSTRTADYKTMRLQEAATGAGLAALMYMIAGMKTENGTPLITGSFPPSGKDRSERDLNYALMKPYSFYDPASGEYKPYRFYEPLATTLAMTADAAQGVREGQAGNERAFQDLAAKFTQLVSDKTALQGLANLMSVLQDPSRGLPKLAGSIATGFVPNAAKEAMRAGDPMIRDNKPRGEGADYLTDFARALGYQALPLASAGLPKVDFAGREVTKDEPAAGLKGYIERLLPIGSGRKEANPQNPADRIALAIYNHNRRYPNDAWAPPSAPNSVSIETNAGPVSIPLTGAEYHDMGVSEGEALVKMLEHAPIEWKRPSGADIEMVKRAQMRARTMATEQMRRRVLERVGSQPVLEQAGEKVKRLRGD